MVPVCHRCTPAIGNSSKAHLLAIIGLPWPMTGRLILLEGHCLLRVSHASVNLWIERNRGFADAHNFGFSRGKLRGAGADGKDSRASHDKSIVNIEQKLRGGLSISWSTT